MSVYKLVVLVRRDLKMKPGRMAAQVGHAAVNAYRHEVISHPEMVKKWLDEGGYLIILQGGNEEQIHRIGVRAEQYLHLYCAPFYDDLVKPREIRTMTCMSIGPDQSNIIDMAIGKLEKY